jgi:hypothetical protein
MNSGDGNGGASDAESALSLARVLRELKRRGSALLVVGTASEEGYGRVCERMLGDDTAGPRRRLLVVTGADSAAAAERARSAHRPAKGTARYITYAACTRSATGNGNEGRDAAGRTDPTGRSDDERIGDGGRDASEGPNGTDIDREGRKDRTTDGPDRTDGTGGTDDADDADRTETALSEHRHIEAGRLAELGDAIEAEIDAIEAESDGLAPAELRVCLDSLTPLLDAHDREAIIRFLDRATTRVKRAHGMCHVHLPAPRDWEAVTALEEPFDAIVELRVEQGRIQQRWQLRDADVTSEWFGV